MKLAVQTRPQARLLPTMDVSFASGSRCLFYFLVVWVHACAASTHAGHNMTPLQKVVEMLGGMIKTAKSEKHDEQVQFAAFKQFCDDVTVEKQASVAKLSQQIELLQAEVQKHGTEAERLAGEITGHAEEIAKYDADETTTSAARHAEHSDYFAARQNLTESVEAVAKALAALKSQNSDRPGVGPSMLLEEEPDLTFVPGVPVTAYRPKSPEMIKMLEDLQDKFRAQLEDLDKKEVQRRHASDVLVQDLTASGNAAEAAKASKTTSKASHLRLEAETTGDLQDVSSLWEKDTKYLQDLNTTCQQKADEYESRQSLRTEEIAALERSVGILSSSEVADSAKKHLPASLVAASTHGLMFVQLRLMSHGVAGSQVEAADFLRKQSTKLSSHVLSALAAQMTSDPLSKVKTLIEELIDRLKTEATREAEHKGWCDTELATNKHTRKAKAEEVEALTVDIDALTADVAQLRKDCAQLSEAVNATEAEVAEATKLRNKERDENLATAEDARKGQAAVANATQTLRDFYARASQATSLSQRQHAAGVQAPPPIFDKAYNGQQAESTGVLGMLEVIRSDFARLEEDTKSAEAAAQGDYDKFMEDSSIAKVQMETDIKHKTKAQQDKQAALEDKKADLEQADSLLTAAQAEFEKLSDACLNQGQTYEERVQRRKDEIEALKQALNILSGDA